MEVSNDEYLNEIISNSKNLEVIDYNSERCVITILGEYKEQKFVMRLSKKEYDRDESVKLLSNGLKNLKTLFKNDIYYKFVADDFISNQCKADFVYPADAKVIDKYKKKELILFRESYEVYQQKTKKYIDSIDLSHTKWIHNALYNRAEELILETNDFIVLRDYKTLDDVSKMNFLGIPFKDIKCLRDLTAENLPLLESFYESVSMSINTRKKQFVKSSMKTLISLDAISITHHHSTTYMYITNPLISIAPLR
jgi:hypothetical protein